MIEYVKAFWAGHGSSNLVQSGKVMLQAHDFFHEQPFKGANAYFLKHVVHDCVG